MRKKIPFHPKGAAFLAAAFLIPLAILVACLYLQKIAPFGEDSLILIDASSQYINYLGYFRSVLRGSNSLLYTFSKNMGGDLLSLAAYYMLSPFNVIFLFFDTKSLPLAFTVVMVLKLSCCGLTYYYASSRFFGHKLTNLAFSTAYALMGYNMIYLWNVMWLDGVILLPLLFLGLYRLVKEGKIGLYCLCIGAGLVTSFYTGYMLCAAAVLFFAALLTVFQIHGKDLLRKGGTFAWASCTGGFAAAIVWLPAVLTLGANRIALTEKPDPLALKTDLPEFTAKFLSGAASTMEIYEGMPHVFCGTLVLILVVLFFLNRKISRRVRMTVLAVIGVLLASFCITGLDIAWHGFSPNRLFNFRYAFLFSFVLILIAQYALEKLEQPRLKALVLPTAVILAVAVTGWLRRPDLAMPGIFVTLAALAMLMAALVCPRRFSALALTLITLAELGINCGLTWDKMMEGTLKLNATDFYYYVDYVEPAVISAKKQEEGFHRIEKTFFKDQNDPMLFDYRGLSHFSSTEQATLMRFLEKMGLRNYFDVWSAYLQGSTAEVDALLGVRYLLSNDDSVTHKNYTLLDSPNGIGVYRNHNALPIAMLSDRALMQVSMEEGNYFSLHNDIWSGLTGRDTRILWEENQISVVAENLTESLRSDGTRLYTKTDPAKPASVTYTLTISREMPLYYYFTAPAEEQDVQVLVNGEDQGAYFYAFRWNMACAGTFTPGETVTISLVPNGDSFLLDECWFCYEDADALSRAATLVKERNVTFTQISGSRFSGTFETAEPMTLFFTIPWDAGWHLVLDGEKVPFEKALDTFLCVSAEPGSHSFEMYFLPRGLTAGAALTAVSALMAVLWFVAGKKYNFGR